MYIRVSPAILWFIYLSFCAARCLFSSVGTGEKNGATLNTKVEGNEYFMNQPSYLLRSKLFLTSSAKIKVEWGSKVGRALTFLPVLPVCISICPLDSSDLLSPCYNISKRTHRHFQWWKILSQLNPWDAESYRLGKASNQQERTEGTITDEFSRCICNTEIE